MRCEPTQQDLGGGEQVLEVTARRAQRHDETITRERVESPKLCLYRVTSHLAPEALVTVRSFPPVVDPRHHHHGRRLKELDCSRLHLRPRQIQQVGVLID
jgi:hypothetical protein